MSEQEILSFPETQKLDWSSFIESSENYEAIKYLIKWPQWDSNGLIIYGNSGVGKTHLANLWKQTAGAVFITEDFLKSDPRNLFFKSKNFIFDDFDNFLKIENFDWLFHFINIAREKQRYFILISKFQPSFWKVNLKDLSSRLLALPTVYIQNPSDELLLKIAEKLCKDLGISIHRNTLQYILNRIDRKVNSVAALLKILDKLSLQNQKKITIQFIKNQIHLF